MFEFSLASLVLIFVVGMVVWHFFSTKILGYVSKAEAALRADWAAFQAELHKKHDLLANDLNAKHDKNDQRLNQVENVQVAMVAAAPAVPVAAVVPQAPGATQTTEAVVTTTTEKTPPQ